MSTIASWDPHPFTVTREDAGSVPVLVVTGGIDARTGPELSAAVCAFGAENVVVDLREVDYIDSDGLRDVLLASRVLAVGLHVVCPPGSAVRSAFDAAGTTSWLTMHDSRGGAVAGRGRGRPAPSALEYDFASAVDASSSSMRGT